MRNPSKKKKIFFRLLTIFISILGALILGEFAVRLFDLAPGLNSVATKIHRLTNNPILKYELVPFVYDGYESINGEGRRDFHYPKLKGNNIFRIALLGDSVAFGWGTNVWSTHPSVLEYYLNKFQKQSRVKFEVWNFGVRGYGTDEEVECLRTKAMAIEPDLVIMTYNLNDPDPHSVDLAWIYSEMTWVDEQYLIDIEKAWNNRLRRGLVAHSDLYRMIKYRILAIINARQRRAVVNKQGREQVALKVKHNYTDKKEKYFYEITQAYWPTVASSFKEFSTLCKEAGIKGQVAILPGFDDLVDYKYLSIHQKVAAETKSAGLLVYDLLPVFNRSAVERPDVKLNLDFNHPNDEGQRLMAWAMAVELISKSLVPLGKEDYEESLFDVNAAIQTPDMEYFMQYDMFFIEQGLNNIFFENYYASVEDWKKALLINPENKLAVKCLVDLFQKTEDKELKAEILKVLP